MTYGLTCECGMPAGVVATSKASTMYRCTRGHQWAVQHETAAVVVPQEPARTKGYDPSQPSVFDQIVDAHPAARHRPAEVTEAAAADAALPGLGTIRRELLRLASRIEGVTGDEAVEALDMDDRQTSVRPALSQLVKMGLAYKSRMHRPNRRGFGEIVYCTNGEHGA